MTTDNDPPSKFMSLTEMSKLSQAKITEDRAAALGLTIIHKEKLGRYSTSFVDRATAMLKVEELRRTSPREFGSSESRVLTVELRDAVLTVVAQNKLILQRLDAIAQHLGSK